MNRILTDWSNSSITISEADEISAELDPAKIIRIERTIAAPRELVFEAFTDPKHLDVWWGPLYQ